MKNIKTFENYNENQKLFDDIKKYLEENYPENWWNEQLGEKAYDYVSDEEIIGYGDEDEPDFESAEDAYVGLAMGGAIEYELLDDIATEICDKFNIDKDDYYNELNIDELVTSYMMSNCDWCDKFLFGEKTSSEDELLNKFLDLPDETSDGIKL